MEFRELYEKSLITGAPLRINDKIQILTPHLIDVINYGERKYYKIIYAFAATSSDYKAQLDDEGIDWQEVSDYEMFIRLFLGMREEDLSILFGDVDFSKLKLAADNTTGELLFIDEENGIKIDRLTYDCISEYICAMNGVEKVTEKAADKATKFAMIEEAREKIFMQRNKEFKSNLRGMICAMANTPEFKADYFGALDYPISIFMDCVRQVQQIKHFTNVMNGIYAGTVDAKNIPKSQLNWLKRAE